MSQDWEHNKNDFQIIVLKLTLHNIVWFPLLQCKDFEKVGATIAVTPCDVVEEADITFSCVADPQAAKEVPNHFI